ncbi:MAG: MGMT family protein [bacterium]|nr:MGMT family protein [bacterium]
MISFTKKVLGVVRRIPKGKTLTYKEVARRAGSRKAFRAVGNILNRHGGIDKGIPCHRVVRSDGTVGGYAWGIKRKERLLRKEKAIS